MRTFILSLLFAASAIAQPVITSVTPATGSVAGNTEITITGSGFLVGAKVFVRDAQATDVNVLNANTIVAHTPIGLPGPAPITVTQQNGYASNVAFAYTGDPLAAYDRMLLPIFTGPVHGAYGSEFHTELAAWNSGASSSPVRMYGITLMCLILCPSLDPLGSPVQLQPGQALADTQGADMGGNPGRFIYVPKSESPALGTFLRVYDVTREASNYGTEIRVVHAQDFSNTVTFAFLSVPTDPRFRLTLRVYGGPEARVADLTINHQTYVPLQLRPGNDLFDPAYAEYSDFPVGAGPIDIEVSAPPSPGGISPPIFYPPVWAFLTVTNNDTQQITTVTPN